MSARQHRIIGATIRARNLTYGLAPAREVGPKEVVTEVVNEYDMTLKTDQGNVYSNGSYLIVRYPKES